MLVSKIETLIERMFHPSLDREGFKMKRRLTEAVIRFKMKGNKIRFYSPSWSLIRVNSCRENKFETERGTCAERVGSVVGILSCCRNLVFLFKD